MRPKGTVPRHRFAPHSSAAWTGRNRPTNLCVRQPHLPLPAVHHQPVVRRQHARPGLPVRPAGPLGLTGRPVQAVDLVPRVVHRPAGHHRRTHLRRLLLPPHLGHPLLAHLEPDDRVLVVPGRDQHRPAHRHRVGMLHPPSVTHSWEASVLPAFAPSSRTTATFRMVKWGEGPSISSAPSPCDCCESARQSRAAVQCRSRCSPSTGSNPRAS
jgi:hypothetical protein